MLTRIIKQISQFGLIMQKKVIIFDFDGTLVDSLGEIIRIFNEHATDFNLPKIGESDIDYLRGKNPREIIKEFHIPLYKIPFIVQKVRAQLSGSVDKLSLFPGMKEVLEKLYKKGCLLAILTSNSHENVRKFLQHHNLQMFDHIFSENSIFGKSQALAKIIKQLGCDPDETVYIGDEVRDIEACKKNSVECIAVTWGFNSKDALILHHPDHIVEAPEEILTVLSKPARPAEFVL